MARVLIHEYICGGGLAGQPLPDSLAREGWAMLSSVAQDFAGASGIETVVTLDTRFDAGRLDVHRVIPVREHLRGDHLALLAAAADWTLLIAPEFSGILSKLARAVIDGGGRLLGCTPDGID